MIGIIDYGMGNLRSVENAFHHLGYESKIIKSPKEVKEVDKIVLPGVGAFGDAIKALREKGLDKAIHEAVEEQKYFLGICLGMQLIFDISYEGGKFEGLKLLKGEILRFDTNPPAGVAYGGQGLKIPHMGWNSLIIKKTSPLFAGLEAEPYVYFDHAYYLATDADIVSAECVYGRTFQAAAESGGIYGLQFHPEKSGNVGLKILNNFGGLELEKS
ncbi:MAG: imidazole glycerol phosphate synthase subunit HisH [Clostridiales bacterium]|jgi:glutamine amidotransferase|nr:imidazole glycerol phosphate synthase subunit HisH [Clostridiales bacterium]